MRGGIGIVVGVILFMLGGVMAVSDSAVFQGQYFEGSEFQEGTFDFNFVVYDDEAGGVSCFSDSQILTTGFWGQWRVELNGISGSCNDVSKDYFMEITIENSTQSPRRRLTHFNYLRKDVNELSSGQINVSESVYVYDLYINNTKVCLSDGTNCQVVNFSEDDTFQSVTERGASTDKNITIGSILTFILGGYFQEFSDRFFLSKNLDVGGNVSANYFIGDGSFLTGIIGQPGSQGTPGINGSQGLQGIMGEQGISGINGTDGIDGVDGVNGTDGINGSIGTDGIDGINGTDGIDGSQGIQGVAGINGTNGVDGTIGPQGIQGEQGVAGINGTDGDAWFDLLFGWLSYTGNLFINGDLNVTGDITSNNKLVCLEDGTNCQIQNFTDTNTNAEIICSSDEVLLGNGSCQSSSSFGSDSSGGMQYVSFISTVDGDLKNTEKYLPLGTDSGISKEASEASWIIDRDLIITGFLWNAALNERDDVSEIILVKSTGSKSSFSETSLSGDIKGVTNGFTIGSVSLSQGDLVAIKYISSGDKKDTITDLSITLIGTYD